MILEELLNKLIEKGRVPFGDEKIHSFGIIYVTGKIKNIVAKRGRGQINKHYSIIELCSKSSCLWQFVCENGMLSETNQGVWANAVDNHFKEILFKYDDYEYRLIEASLKNEDELEQFLLSNIVIKDGE